MSPAGLTHHFFAGALFEGGGAYGIALLSRFAMRGIQVTELPRISDEQRVLLTANLPEPGATIWTMVQMVAPGSGRLAVNKTRCSSEIRGNSVTWIPRIAKRESSAMP